MRTRTTVIALVLPALAALSVPAALAAAGPTPSLHVGHHGRLIPTKGEVLPTRNADAASLNWAGYAVVHGGITGVQQAWTVPAAGLTPPGFSATWAGIGGYNTSDLIQAGTTQDSLPIGGPQYYAWWETLPDAETPITSGCTGGDPTCAVTPGDKFTVDIHEVGTNRWSITLVNTGKWSWSSPPISYTSTHSSAEWILEAPTLVVQTTLASVGTQPFYPTNTYTDGTGTHPIGQGSPVSIDMGPGLLVEEAATSGLASDGQSFNVCAWALSCPTP